MRCDCMFKSEIRINSEDIKMNRYDAFVKYMDGEGRKSIKR